MIEANRENVTLLIVHNNRANKIVPQKEHRFVEIDCEAGRFTVYKELAEMFNIKEGAKIDIGKAFDLIVKNSEYGKMICQKALKLKNIEIPIWLAI